MLHKIRGFVISSIIISAFLSLSGCGEPDTTAAKNESIAVKAEKVTLQDISFTLDYVGSIRAKEEAVIFSRVPGKIIEKLKEDSSPVEKGDIIAYIDRDEVGFKFEKAPVESPMKGVIGRFYCDIGQNVTPQTPIALVVDMDKAEIILDIPEKYLPKVNVGNTAYMCMDAYPGECFPGKVTKVSPVLDLDTRTAPIEITADNPYHRMRSGMFSKVNLVLEEHKQVPSILKEAVLGKGEGTYVYVVENQIAKQRKVKLGLRQGPYYEVIEGLLAGEIVVVMGQQRLYEGAAVSIEEQK
jgi:multidrug efflux pump subunit AcrA (membrane-fusion protein)